MSLRANRVAEQIKKEIGMIVGTQLKNPKIGFVTITDVEITNDLQEATIFVSVLGTDYEKRQTLEGLRESKGFLRSEIGKKIRLRKVPEIEFEFDYSIEYGDRIEQLLKQVKEEQ